MINFPFETNGKSKVLGVPILSHLRVYPIPNKINIHARRSDFLIYINVSINC